MYSKAQLTRLIVILKENNIPDTKVAIIIGKLNKISIDKSIAFVKYVK